jgi:cytosine/adenosine deaminase-related metal-dependent hydrolase
MQKYYMPKRDTNSRKGQYSYKGVAQRLLLEGITTHTADKFYVYFECTAEQLEKFRMRMRIYVGYTPYMSKVDA